MRDRFRLKGEQSVKRTSTQQSSSKVTWKSELSTVMKYLYFVTSHHWLWHIRIIRGVLYSLRHAFERWLCEQKQKTKKQLSIPGGVKKRKTSSEVALSSSYLPHICGALLFAFCNYSLSLTKEKRWVKLGSVVRLQFTTWRPVNERMKEFALIWIPSGTTARCSFGITGKKAKIVKCCFYLLLCLSLLFLWCPHPSAFVFSYFALFLYVSIPTVSLLCHEFKFEVV